VPPEVWAADEQDRLLLLEPEEFLQGVTCGPTCSVPWITPESPACLHLAVIGLDVYLWYRSYQSSTQEIWQPERPAVARTKVAVGWPEVEEALVLLQLWANVDVLLMASWQELSQHVCAFTKALTQRPFKQSRESGAFSFCTTGRWAAAENSGKRWHRPAGGLVAADQAVQLRQPGCGQCCCCCLPLPLPSATGLNAAHPGNRLETTSGGVREQDTQYDLHRGSQA
ncbi:hypothetical protein E2I00_009222, partial [Balaenoptera physalus]